MDAAAITVSRPGQPTAAPTASRSARSTGDQWWGLSRNDAASESEGCVAVNDCASSACRVHGWRDRTCDANPCSNLLGVSQLAVTWNVPFFGNSRSARTGAIVPHILAAAVPGRDSFHSVCGTGEPRRRQSPPGARPTLRLTTRCYRFDGFHGRPGDLRTKWHFIRDSRAL